MGELRLVRLVRSMLGIRQRDLAERSGTSVRELVRIERGEVLPARATAAAIDRAVEEMIVERATKDNKED